MKVSNTVRELTPAAPSALGGALPIAPPTRKPLDDLSVAFSRHGGGDGDAQIGSREPEREQIPLRDGGLLSDLGRIGLGFAGVGHLPGCGKSLRRWSRSALSTTKL